MENRSTRPIRSIFIFPLLLFVLLQSCGRQTGSLGGKILLADRDSYEGTRVSILDTNLTAETAGDGRYSLTSIPPGDYTFTAKREGYGTLRKQIAITAGMSLELEPITLTPEEQEPADLGYGNVVGNVILSDGQNPGGTVIVVADSRDSTTVDSEGSFVLEQVPAGDHNLMAVKGGYRPAGVAVSVIPDVTITVGTFTLEPIEALRTRTGIEGTVKIAGNRAPAGVLVLLEGTSLMQITDGTGRFAFLSLDPGVYSLSIQKTGFRESRIVGVLVEKGRMTPVEASLGFATFDGSEPDFLTEPGGLAGNVTTPIAEDRDGVLIWLSPGGKNTVTNPDGTFSLRDIRPGTYIVSASREFYHRADVIDVVVRPGEMTQVGEIAITPMGPEELIPEQPSTLSGMLLLEGELNNTGIMAALTNTQFSTVTGFDGTFFFDKVLPGVYTLVASHEGFDPVEKDVEIPPGRDIILPPIELPRTVIAPRIVSVDPPDGAQRVTVDDFVQIVIQFDQRMDGRSLKESFRIQPRAEYRTYFGNEGVADYSPSRTIDYPAGMSVEAGARSEAPPSGEDRLVVRLLRYGRPPVALNRGYTVIISKRAANIEGVSIEEPYNFTFKTGGARLTRTWPKNGAQNVVVLENDALLFDFNDRIDIETFKKAFRISPRPASDPEFLRQRVPSGDRVRVELQLSDNTPQEVTISREIRTWNNGMVENTPFQLRFRSGSIDSLEGAQNLDEYFIEGDDTSRARQKLLEGIGRRRAR